MTSATDSPSGNTNARRADPGERWSLTSLIRRHKRIAAGSIAVVLALVAVTLVTTVTSPSRQPLADSASCAQWAAATPGQKTAYSHVYIEEYGRFANTAARAAAVEAAINQACTKASYLGEADDLSILAGIRHAF
jgi:hypothetical protein